MTITEDLTRVTQLLQQAMQLLEAHTIPAAPSHSSPDAKAFIEAAGIIRHPSRSVKSVKFRDFYDIYTVWCADARLEAHSRQRIGAQLTALGYAKGHRSWGKQILGMEIPDSSPYFRARS